MNINIDSSIPIPITSGSDFDPVTANVLFSSGAGVGSTASFDVVIINDDSVEEFIETFTVSLDTPTLQPTIISGVASAGVSIQEDLSDSTCLV